MNIISQDATFTTSQLGSWASCMTLSAPMDTYASERASSISIREKWVGHKAISTV